MILLFICTPELQVNTYSFFPEKYFNHTPTNRTWRSEWPLFALNDIPAFFQFVARKSIAGIALIAFKPSPGGSISPLWEQPTVTSPPPFVMVVINRAKG